MIHYIIQVIAFQLFFLLIYDVFLKKETFFNWNRVYLLSTALLSVCLPLIKIKGLKQAVPNNLAIGLPELFAQAPNTIFLDPVVINASNNTHSLVWYVSLCLAIGSFLALLVFSVRLFHILNLAYRSSKQQIGRFKIVNLNNSTAAFSFFNYIFIGNNISEQDRDQILKHECVHVKQKHSLDLLFFEIIRIFFWFNPLVYIYQKRIADVHEFIADSQAIKQNKKQYYENLLAQVFDTKQVSFINPFFKQSLIKKRIIMLQKSKSNQVQLLKYALLIPMVLGMLVYSSCSNEATEPDKNEQSSNIIEVEKPLTVENQITVLERAIEEQGELSETEKQALRKMYVNTLEGTRTDGTIEVIEVVEEVASASDVEVPFAVIEQAPVFPGCENLTSNAEKKNCMHSKLSAFIGKNFNNKLAKSLNLSGNVSIRTFFKINASGKIVAVKVRAPHPELEAEARRVINLIPDLIPGEQGGKKVTVPYYLPIKFEINE